MEIQAIITFNIADLPEKFLNKHFVSLIKLYGGSDPVVIGGVSIYSESEALNLAIINMAKITGYRSIDKVLYIIKDKMYSEIPSWLQTIDYSFSIDIELDKNLDVDLEVKTSPHGGNTEIRFRGKRWRTIKPILEPLAKMEKSQDCVRCGQLLVYSNGDFINDPRVTTCQCFCPERIPRVEPVSV
ncbi:MAG: hypothetical protein WCP03_03195 [Candidatus Saccharibacteria bacterium]